MATMTLRPWKLAGAPARLGAVLLGASLLAASALPGAGPALAMVPSAVAPPALWRGNGAPWLAPGPGDVPGHASGLQAVFCTSAANCWAVGYYEIHGAWLNEALHWNGRNWSRVAVPSPGGTASGATSELFGVRCTMPANCWAVGYSEKRQQAELSEALHWNGSKWFLVSTPDPGGSLSGEFSFLADVVCTSPINCWADGDYGYYGTETEVILNLALHWNGKNWSQAATPDPGGTGTDEASALNAIRCTSPSNCWGVGTYGTIGSEILLLNEVLHWNGKKWSRTMVPDPAGDLPGDDNELSGLSCTSAANCWAVGAYSTPGPPSAMLNQMLHWNGAHWSRARPPNPDGTGEDAANTLIAVSCSSARNCFTVGDLGSYALNNGEYLNQALRWNGTKWSVTSTPEPAGKANGDVNMLEGIRCVSSANCWAVGNTARSGSSENHQVLHWNGKHWSAG
jgi:hypothetical protein